MWPCPLFSHSTTTAVALRPTGEVKKIPYHSFLAAPISEHLSTTSPFPPDGLLVRRKGSETHRRSSLSESKRVAVEEMEEMFHEGHWNPMSSLHLVWSDSGCIQIVLPIKLFSNVPEL